MIRAHRTLFLTLSLSVSLPIFISHLTDVHFFWPRHFSSQLRENAWLGSNSLAKLHELALSMSPISGVPVTNFRTGASWKPLAVPAEAGRVLKTSRQNGWDEGINTNVPLTAVKRSEALN